MSIKSKKIYNIVITGGPCGGKSTIMEKIEKTFSKMGYVIFIIPETATELIPNGVKPFGINEFNIVDFQKIVLKKQLAKEKLYKYIAELSGHDKVIILHDRGILDGQAYVTPDEFNKVLQSENMSLEKARDRYDLVLHLVSAANGAEEFYTCENNSARTETVEEAREKDKLTLNAWIGHPRLRVIDNSTSFDKKIERALQELCVVCNETLPLEIERKFLINLKETDFSKMKNHEKVRIIQSYLKSNNPNVERRIRQRGKDTDVYFYTEKEKISELERIEVENVITLEEYALLMKEIDCSYHQIAKTRHCFLYDNQYYELDVFDFNDEIGLLEIELNSIEQEVSLPPFVKIIKEVTNDKKYKNKEIAKTLSL